MAGVSVTLIDAKPEFVERIRLHQVAAGQQVRTWPYRTFLNAHGVKFVQATVTMLDPSGMKLAIRKPDGTSSSLGYDYLVYALGSHIQLESVEGAREHAHTLNSLEAATKIASLLHGPEVSRVTVVGGGLTGIETAAELAESFPHLRITLATRQPYQAHAVPGGYSINALNYLHSSFSKLGIALRHTGRIEKVNAECTESASGEPLPHDLCIWTTGFLPPPLATAAGIRVNAHGQIITDPSLVSVSHPNIIAVGDAAEIEARDGGPCRMGSATGLAMGTAGVRTLTALMSGKRPPAFRFNYLFRNICLGRKDGVIQFVDRRDVPRSIVWTGSAAVRWKEYICRSTLSTIGFIPAEKLPAIPPLRMLPQLLRAPGQYA
jgi:NADH dehydrogenase FAD-containing subunit